MTKRNAWGFYREIEATPVLAEIKSDSLVNILALIGPWGAEVIRALPKLRLLKTGEDSTPRGRIHFYCPDGAVDLLFYELYDEIVVDVGANGSCIDVVRLDKETGTPIPRKAER